MLRSIYTALKEHPRITLLVTSIMIGCIIGGIIVTKIDFNLIGFGAIGGAATGLGLSAISIYCCCPPPAENALIDNTPLTRDNEAQPEESPPLIYTPTNTSSTDPTTIIVSEALPSPKEADHILAKSKLIT